MENPAHTPVAASTSHAPRHSEHGAPDIKLRFDGRYCRMIALADVIAGFSSELLRELVTNALTLRAGFAECSYSTAPLKAIAVALEEAVQPGRRREFQK